MRDVDDRVALATDVLKLADTIREKKAEEAA